MALLWLSGCGLEHRFRPLDIAADSRSIIVVFEHFGELIAMALHVADQSPDSAALLVDPETPLAALEYSQDLSELGIDQGPMHIERTGKLLPDARAFWLLPSVSTSTGWERRATMPEIAARVRLPLKDWTLCAGCQRATAGVSFQCSTICPDAVQPETPREAAAPSAPGSPIQSSACVAPWSKRQRGVAVWCEPPPHLSCAFGALQGLDDTSCVPVSVCDGLGSPPDDTLWVTPGGRGDGSRALPLGDVSVAIRASRAGQTIALVGEGVLPPFVLDREVVIRGTCDGKLSIGGDGTGMSVGVRAPSSLIGVVVEGEVFIYSHAELSIDGTTLLGALTVEPTATLRAANSTLHSRAEVAGAFAATELTSTATGAANFFVEGGGTLTLRRARLVHTGPSAILVARESANLELSDVWITGNGAEIELAERSRLQLERVGAENVALSLTTGSELVGNQITLQLGETGVQADSARLELTDVILVSSSEIPLSGNVLQTRTATLSLRRAVVDGVAGTLVKTMTSSVSIEDLVVGVEEGANAVALSMDGGDVAMRRFSWASDLAISCEGGGRLKLSDGDMGGKGDRRAIATGDCAIEGQRMAINGLVRVETPAAMGAVAFVDLAVDVHGNPAGLAVTNGATAELARVRVVGATQNGLLIKNGAHVTGEDLDVHNAGVGFGVLVIGSAVLDVTRLRVRSADVGLQVNQGRFIAKDVEIIEGGTGLSVTFLQDELRVTRLLARNSRGAGLSMDGVGPRSLLSSVEARDNGVGVELATDQPLGTILESVRYVRNRQPAVICPHWPCVAR